MSGSVALYTSAWIEIYPLSRHKHLWCVALYTSAWIEIALTDCVRGKCRCRTLHECVDWNPCPHALDALSLRRTLHECVDWNFTPLMRQVVTSRRTLHECVDWNNPKLRTNRSKQRSHSTRVRGLKLNRNVSIPPPSHSTRVRGLK